MSLLTASSASAGLNRGLSAAANRRGREARSPALLPSVRERPGGRRWACALFLRRCRWKLMTFMYEGSAQ
jgi:hypothetical protein